MPSVPGARSGKCRRVPGSARRTQLRLPVSVCEPPFPSRRAGTVPCFEIPRLRSPGPGLYLAMKFSLSATGVLDVGMYTSSRCWRCLPQRNVQWHALPFIACRRRAPSGAHAGVVLLRNASRTRISTPPLRMDCSYACVLTCQVGRQRLAAILARVSCKRVSVGRQRPVARCVS